MTPLFTINFRREAYVKEVARTRRRVIALAVWVAYFGALAVLLGLYGLNCVSIARRTEQIERQTAHLRGSQESSVGWSVAQADWTQIEHYATDPREWHDRLVRLAASLPPHVRLVSLSANPQNLSGPDARRHLIISGLLRSTEGEDRMQSVMKIVTALSSDSLFARGYQTVKLASTRLSGDAGGTAEFVIECR